MRSPRIFVTVFLIAGCSAALASHQSASSAPPPDNLPAGPGKSVMVKTCSDCHDAQRAASLRLTHDGWAAVVSSMIDAGAAISDADFKAVVDYLATVFPGDAAQALNVNTAVQLDLEMVAGLLRREAAAVIDYRDKNGPFKTLDDMKKVPGIEFAKIDARREYLIAMPPPAPKPAGK